ncbi:MAG: MutS-related protein [Candidatus Polarisedimenticolia bacterium]
MTSSPTDPRETYTARRQARLHEAARLDRIEVRLSGARLAVAAAAAVVAWLAFGQGMLSGWWLLAPAAVFAALAVVHDRVIRARRRLLRAAEFYARGLARLDHRWAGAGEPGSRFQDPHHLYAVDLDLFGSGSLFELLCTARTRAGEEALASWLKAPAPPREVPLRQEAVRELAPRLDLREELALLGADVRAGVHPEELAAWGTEPAMLTSAWVPRAGAALSAVTIASAAAWAAGMTGAAPLVLAGLVQAGFALSQRNRVLHVVGKAATAARDLALLAQVLARIEAEPVTSPQLLALRAALETQGVPPSRRIARVHALMERLDARRNQLFGPIAAALLWTTQIAYALERWRAVSGPAVAGWLRAVGEFEGLCALASYAYENPADPFPRLVEGEAMLVGRAMGHPLIPKERCVPNDVALGGTAPAVLIVTGSNMSGKSTLLRTVGVNTVLAMAGGPVRAASMSLSPLSLGASMRTQDSLQDGTSRFYAEITRLRQIMDLTRGGLPVLFLLDEMLHGTNSHDRRIGAEAVVKGLVARGAIGMVTTHDLALAHIAEALGPRADCVHFEDHLEQGRIFFDYLMRPGVVRKSNALELMRSVGLDIDPS